MPFFFFVVTGYDLIKAFLVLLCYSCFTCKADFNWSSEIARVEGKLTCHAEIYGNDDWDGKQFNKMLVSK